MWSTGDHTNKATNLATGRRAFCNVESKAGFQLHGYGPGWKQLYCQIPFWRMYANGIRIQERMVGVLMGIPVPW